MGGQFWPGPKPPLPPKYGPNKVKPKQIGCCGLGQNNPPSPNKV